MAHIHEKLYQSGDYARIEFGEYIKELTSQLYNSSGLNPESVGLKTHVEDIYLDINTSIPLGLIINELVSNAMKHAFSDGRTGEIVISMKTEGDYVTLSVADNGVGFPRHLDFRNTESLGLQFIKALTEQLEGTIELDRDKGTRFVIGFEKGTLDG